MRKIIWEIQCHSLPLVVKHCKKCGKEEKFYCTKKFRVNEQKKSLDIWLIYSCTACNTTWNARVYAHVSPQALSQKQLNGFMENNYSLVKRYAMNADFLYNSGAGKILLPQYSVVGEEFSLNEAVELEIKTKYPLAVKVIAIIKEKLHLPHSACLRLIENNNIKSTDGSNLKKYRLKNGISLIFKPETETAAVR